MTFSAQRLSPIFAVLFATCIGGCTKDESAKPAPAASASASAAPQVAAATGASSGSAAPAASSAAPAASGAPTAGVAGAFEGAFTSKVGKVTPPADAKMKLWEKDPGKDGVGPGTIKLAFEGRTVTGEVAGALGVLLVNGDLDDRVFTARLDPKDPNAQEAWTGTLSGKLEADGVSVVLRVSNRNANLAREAEAKLTKR